MFLANTNCTSDKYEEIFQDLFCNGSYVHWGDKPICANISKWINEKNTAEYLDPHDCYGSCKTPGPGCAACTNETYFQCTKDGARVCLHPELRCDGHPQCEYAEDEDVLFCRDKYVQKQLIAPFASKVCTSRMYANMKTIATVCNGIPECDDASDENCKEANLSNILLGSTFGGVLLLYLGLKLSRAMYRKFFKSKKTELSLPRQNFETLLKRLKEDHEDIAAIEDVNNFLLHTIHTEKIQKTIELCELYYALEADVHKKDVPEIFCCLHRRLDPIVITEVHETQYPGIRTRFFRWIEKKFKTNIITNIRNRIIQTERLGQLISTVQSVIKIESSVLDLFKDLFLATSILFTIGGPVSVWLFPTNFSSIVAMIAFATVIIPLVLSSLMLIITDPWAIVTFDNKRNVPRLVMTLLCFLLFGITPILLLNSFKAIKEEAQRTAKKNKKTMSQIFKDYRAVKRIFVELLKIELGKDTLLK